MRLRTVLTSYIRRFSELPSDNQMKSAPVIQHPNLADTPAYRVKVLEPAPAPITKQSATNTPAASSAPTPRSEPVPSERVLTVSEVTTMFLKTLLQSAEDFLGHKVRGAVICIPGWFGESQRKALVEAATAAGICVLQLLEEAGAVVAATCDLTTSPDTNDPSLAVDRTQLIVDLGASSLELSLISIREGLGCSLARSSSSNASAALIDQKLIKFFAKEFTKKAKIPLTVAPASHIADKRAEAKLLLAVEHTKRTLSASPGAATCSVESLKEGIDFTGSINRMRFDMEVRSIYNEVLENIRKLAKEAGMDLYEVDEIVYVGGSACLPGLDETLAPAFRDDVRTPFQTGSVQGGPGDPTTLLARGCVQQASLLTWIKDAPAGDKAKEKLEGLSMAYEHGTRYTDTSTVQKSLALAFPASSALFPVVLRGTPIPCIRTVSFNANAKGDKLGVELWEVNESIKITKTKPIPLEPEDDEDEVEEEDEIETKEKVVEKGKIFGAATVDLKGANAGARTVTVTITVSKDGLIGLAAALDSSP